MTFLGLCEIRNRVAIKIEAAAECPELFGVKPEDHARCQRLAIKARQRVYEQWKIERQAHFRSLPGLNYEKAVALMRRRGYTHVRARNGDLIPIGEWYPYGKDNGIWNTFWRAETTLFRDILIDKIEDPTQNEPLCMWVFETH